ncbi:hypothetical protein [Isobaculum melis]|uniref:Gram-positive cocci surface proteins LPxTG domain-containing protein n=1 Tax=Isobaculum melis TaxID=142588 RepID=A0A1H9R2V1_9LACT|nr:hypothetical protein [Isobaculum melis]SER67064.1 hypothetical protein SAMN04488559_10323 [Isobaculum melis]
MKNDLAKKFLKSALILGVGVTTFVSPLLAGHTAVQAAEEQASTRATLWDPDATEVLVAEKNIVIGYKDNFNGSGKFDYRVFGEGTNDIDISASHELVEYGVPFTVSFEHDGEQYEFTLTREKPAAPVSPIETVKSVLYNGKAITASNFPKVHVGSDGQINVADFTFVDAEGNAVDGDITATPVDTSIVSATQKTTITLTEQVITRSTPKSVSIEVPVVVANPTMVKTTVEEVTYTIKSTSTEANPSILTTQDGKIKLEAWSIGTDQYTVRTTNVETGETKLNNFDTTYGTYTVSLINDILNTTSDYVFNFNFDNTPAGTKELENTTTATPENASKPTNLAKTNVNLGVIPSLGGLGLMGLSGAAFFKSRKNKK